MTSFVIFLHVVVAILFLGPVTVAVSAFPGQAVKAAAGADAPGTAAARGAVSLLYRMTNRYGVLSVLVPLIGVAVMFTNPSVFWRMGQFHAAIVLSVIAWGLLLFLIVPRQRKVVAALGLLPDEEGGAAEAASAGGTVDVAAQKGTLAMLGGIFSLLWVIIAVLMFI